MYFKINVYCVFEDASVDTILLNGIKTQIPSFPKSTIIKSISNQFKLISERLNAISLGIWDLNETIITNEINQTSQISFQKGILLNGNITINDFLEGYMGMKSYEFGKGMPIQTREMMVSRIYNCDSKIDESYFPLIGAGNVQRYFLRDSKEFIKYGKNLAAPRDIKIFTGPRILVNRILSKERIDACFVDDTIINNTDVFNFISKNNSKVNILFLLAIISSRVCSTYLRGVNINLDRATFPKLNVNNILTMPLPKSILEDAPEGLIKNVEIIQSLFIEIQETTQKFQRSLERKFALTELPKKLQDWYLLSYADFIKELGKKKIKLSLSEEAEWEMYFTSEAKKALELKAQIDKTDKEIDQMVYALYELTEDEIKIVEAS